MTYIANRHISYIETIATRAWWSRIMFTHHYLMKNGYGLGLCQMSPYFDQYQELLDNRRIFVGEGL
jgi:hypothetical protein